MESEVDSSVLLVWPRREEEKKDIAGAKCLVPLHPCSSFGISPTINVTMGTSGRKQVHIDSK